MRSTPSWCSTKAPPDGKPDGISYLGFKSYDQGRRKFQGTGKHVIWLDEEPPADVYDECLLRLMTTNGLMLCTFTPLLGLSDVAMRFLPELAPAETYPPKAVC
jgi:phage terminase large subunit-like protein